MGLVGGVVVVSLRGRVSKIEMTSLYEINCCGFLLQFSWLGCK